MSTNGYRLVNCSICGKAFRSNRSHATTCSVNCRMKKSRQGRAKKGVTVPANNVTEVTLSYLDFLAAREGFLTMPTPEDWQNS